jgi:hypothetical protein
VFKRGLLFLSFLNQKTPGVFTGGLTAALLIRQNRRKAVPICVYGSYQLAGTVATDGGRMPPMKVARPPGRTRRAPVSPLRPPSYPEGAGGGKGAGYKSHPQCGKPFPA